MKKCPAITITIVSCTPFFMFLVWYCPHHFWYFIDGYFLSATKKGKKILKL